MPKAAKKKKKATKKAAAKRTVMCGKCKGEGHNARTCPTAEKATAPKVTPVPKVLPESDDRRQSKVPKREGQTDKMGAATAHVSPYRCKKCNSVAILVAVKIKDHNASFKKKKDWFQSDLRCEKCMNKPSPSDLILKWGATPDEIVPVPGQDA